MAIANFPAVLQPIIQTGYLERRFEQSLRAKLGFTAVADRETFSARIGESSTRTRAGLLPLGDLEGLNPTQNTNFDNGMTDSQWEPEQYTVTMKRHGRTMTLNVVDDRVRIASSFVQNAVALGEHSQRYLDTLARNALFGSYLGGNTFVRNSLGAPSTTVAVDNVRGFVAGSLVVISGTTATLSAIVEDATNVSTLKDFGGVSGSLVFTANIAVADGAAGEAVVSATAPVVLRPNGRASTADLVAGDRLKMVENIIRATAIMRDNAVPTSTDGFYHAFLDNQTMASLFQDEDFKLLFRGTGSTEGAYREGQVVELAGIRFVPTNLAPQQSVNGRPIKRTIVCGAGALVRADFEGQDAADAGDGTLLRSSVDGITMITRPPVDRLGELVAQSWKWIGGFAVPTDRTANPTVIPTANNSAFKRAIVIESTL